MQADLLKIRLDAIAIHRIHRANEENDGNPAAPKYAKDLSHLSTDPRKFLQERVKETAAETSVANIEELAPVPGKPHRPHVQIRAIFQNADDLLMASKALAKLLFEAQGKRRGADYLFLTARGTGGETPVVVLFTMTVEEGMRAIFNDAVDTPELEHIHDLVLKGKAKLSKLVIVERAGPALEGIVEDSLVRDADAATYFLQEFLGMQTTESARKQTKQFDALGLKMVNTHVATTKEKIDLSRALLNTIHSPKANIHVSDFRKNHVPAKYQAAFDSEVTKRSLPKGKITRDTALVRRSNFRIILDDGIEIVVPPGVPEEAIETGEDKAGPFIKLRGRLKRVE